MAFDVSVLDGLLNLPAFAPMSLPVDTDVTYIPLSKPCIH